MAEDGSEKVKFTPLTKEEMEREQRAAKLLLAALGFDTPEKVEALSSSLAKINRSRKFN